MAKFRLLHQLLLEQGIVQADEVHKPLSIARRDLESVHPRTYHEAFSRDRLTRQEQRRIGLPATRPLVQRTWIAVGGTLLTARLALKRGLASHLAGGTHHAHPGFGSGFCIFNDCAVAARVLLGTGEVRRILIVDLDVHQGDGSAACFHHAAAFILNLPNQPVGGQDPPNAKLLGWILSIAMADCIHQGLVQPQLNALSREDTTNRLSEQLQQRGKLQCGRQGELSPAKPLGRHSWAR